MKELGLDITWRYRKDIFRKIYNKDRIIEREGERSERERDRQRQTENERKREKEKMSERKRESYKY